MTGPRVDVPPLGKVLSGDEWEAAQYVAGKHPVDPKQDVGLNRVLTGDEWEHAQTLPGRAVKSLRIPALPVIAPRDVTLTQADPKTKGKPLAPFDIKDPTTYANPVLRQVINPMLENPFTTAATTVAPFAAAGVAPALGLAVGGAMAGSMVYHIAQYGWQKAAELQLSPEDRKRAEADPERISGESAAVQAAMLGLAPLIHVGVKSVRGPAFSEGMLEAGARGVKEYGGKTPDGPRTGMNSDFAAKLEDGAATARIPNDVERPAGFEPTAGGARLKNEPRAVKGLERDPLVVPGKVKPVETLPANASLEERAAYNEAVRAYEAERLAQDQADVSAARAKDAERIAAADAMRPRRREKATFFESEQGAEVLGMTAARHGLPNDANPYHPASPLAESWTAGHATSTESFPEGFSMGGSLAESRIPAASEVPKVARGIDGLQQSIPMELPEGITSENVALAQALKPSRFRGLSTDALAEAALDAQTAIETAQANIERAVTRPLTGERAMADFENRGVSYSDEVEGSSKVAEKQLAAAKQRMAQIEREYALRGVRGDELADVIAGAKDARLERQAMQEEGVLSRVTGEDDPFASPASVAEPVAAGAGSAQGLAEIEGTGAVRERGLSAGIAQKALANKLDLRLSEVPEYRALNMQEQAVRASAFLAENPEMARRVALGEVPPPRELDLLPESVLVAVENKAIAEGDVAMIRELVNSRLTSDATTMGRRIRALAERDPESPIAAIQSVIDVRQGGAKSVPKATLETVAEIRAKLKGVAVTQEAWTAFIESLRC